MSARKKAQPPGKTVVAYRALSLACLVSRAELEQMAQGIVEGAPPAMLEATRLRIAYWISSEKIEPHLTARESALLEISLGEWTEQDLVEASWRTESLGVLLWALGRIDVLPAWDTPFPLVDVVAAAGLDRPADRFMREARLRPARELTQARDLAEMWSWRARTERARLEGEPPPDGGSYEESIARAVEKARERGEIAESIDDDFVAMGKAYRALAAEEFADVEAIASERALAVRWLAGRVSSWDEAG